MFNICSKCGENRPDKAIVKEGSYAVCPCCGFKHKFIQLPLFILSGASGTGKSTICRTLAGYTKEVVVMESDILWRRELEQPEADLRKYRETWLRVCKNISQSGKPVILCGSEIPANLEDCVERRYFSEIYYLALICEDDILDSRLRSRPTWRGFTDELINEHISFNCWFKSNAYKTNPPITLLDRISTPPKAANVSFATWVEEYEHPVVGRLVFDYTSFVAAETPDLRLVVYTPLPASDTLKKLQQLQELHQAKRLFA